SEELFKAVVHHSPIGIAITDEMGNLIEFNDSMANILGYSRSELKSMNFEEFTHKEDLEKEWRLIKEMISGRRKDYRIRKRYIHKDGHYIWVDVISSLVFVKEGYPTFGFGFIQDITEDIKAEKELKEERDRSEFYKDLLAHDMGNILNNIKSSIDLIRIQKEEKLNSINTSEMLNIVENQIMRGTSLISNVRKLSKFEKLSSKTVEINLQDILNKAIIEIKGIYLSKKVEISTKIPKQPIFIKAGELLFDVFSNIMLNSIIHNNREPILISIKISELKENNRNYVKIEFQDNAFGIEDYRKKSYWKNRNYLAFEMDV
ncbi:MAG: PAS domain S-box protein, partial [Candidatus Lokiarchaeota archaeon]